MKVFISYLLI